MVSIDPIKNESTTQHGMAGYLTCMIDTEGYRYDVVIQDGSASNSFYLLRQRTEVKNEQGRKDAKEEIEKPSVSGRC